MKKLLFSAVLLAFGLQYGFAQDHVAKSQRMITTPGKGKSVEFRTERNIPTTQPAMSVHAPMAPGINWEATDAASIDNVAKVSTVSQKTAAGWGLNDQRLSLYGTTNVPDWEVSCSINAWDESVDMTDDGSRMVNGYNDLVEVYEPSSSVPVWTTTIKSPLSVRGVQIQDDGQKIFVAAGDVSTQDTSFIFCFTVGENAPLWEASIAGNFATMVISKSGNRVLVGEYGSGINKLFAMNATDGSVISELTYADQYTPGISYDGKFVVSGDFSGHVFLYEYNEATSSYAEKWTTSVNGASTWVCGMGISADGTTIAVGTLDFTSSGGFDGDVYVYNNNSPTPLWIYTGMGDMVQSVDLSDDGSIIAAASWGPIGNAAPDLAIFRRQSNVPYFTVNSPGSLFTVDLSPDGKQCVAGGKGVHAREFGMGGKLYNVNSDLGGGTLSGTVLRSGSGELAGTNVEIVGLATWFTYTNETGAYVLPNIPEGTYTVRYSAVGYITQDIAGVQFTAGQVTTQDVTLLPAGAPPFNLFATQGAGYTVDLTWLASPAPGVTGYNVYRKQYSFENYPAAPIGTVGAAELTYSDATALPLTHYYYVVTAALPGDLQSPYSNEAIGWISTGFITDTINAYVGTTPTIDGVITPGEWSDAFQVDLSNVLGRRDNLPRAIGSVMGYFKVNSDLTSLYVAVDNTNDTELNDHDEVALYIDDNNDGFFPAPGDSTEGNYWAVYYASGNLIRYRPIYNNGGVGFTEVLANPQIEVSAASGHVVYEFVLPLGSTDVWQIDYNSENQSGLFAFVLDDPAYYNGWWPATNLNIFTAEGYGVIDFGAVDAVPPPPINLQLFNGVAEDIMLMWEAPPINDFDHYNVYESTDGGTTYTLIDATIGVQYFLTVPSNGLYMFYVTTVDHAGQESIASNIVQADVVIGVDNHGSSGDLSMIKMGPNPFDQQLNIDLNAVQSTNLNIRVFDMNGTQVATVCNESVSSGSHHIVWSGKTLNGANLASGVYVVRFETTNGVAKTFKMIVK
jgi:fibronectin type 3 domain-containing protein